MATEKKAKKRKPFKEGTVGWYLMQAGYRPQYKHSAVICWFDPQDNKVSTIEAWHTLRAEIWPQYKRIERESKREFKRELKEILQKGKDEREQDPVPEREYDDVY